MGKHITRILQKPDDNQNAGAHVNSLSTCRTFYLVSKVSDLFGDFWMNTKQSPNGFLFSGGTEQEVSDAWPPDPTVCGDVHLHQCSVSVHEMHTAPGSLHHHPHHLQASDAGRLHDPSFHWCGFRLQVRLWWNCDVKPVTESSWVSVN